MTDLPLPFVVNMREYEKCSTVLEKFDWMLSTQGSLRFAGHRFDEAKGEAYGVALMMFMEDYGVQLRTALALHESAKTNAEVPLPEPRISVSSYTSNGPEQMEFVTADQLHAYAAAKTAELQAECGKLQADIFHLRDDFSEMAALKNKVEAECARLREALAISERPDMFWDDDDNERCCESICEIVSNRWENGASIGDIFKVQRAISLPRIMVRIIEVPATKITDEDWDYEIVDAALRGKESGDVK